MISPPPAATGLDSAAVTAAASAKTVGFCRLLRQHGFRPGLRESADTLRIAEIFLCANFAAFRDGLRSLLCTSGDQYALFERLFEGFWCPADGAQRIIPVTGPPRRGNPRQGSGLRVTTGVAAQPGDSGLTHLTTGASALELEQNPDLSGLPMADQDAVEQAAKLLWRRMRIDRPGRRRGRNWRKEFDIRRTIRANLSRGGEPVQLVLKGRKPRKPRLVVLLDISGSMELHSFTFLRLLHALQGHFRTMASFVFSTHLMEVSAVLSQADLRSALSAVSRMKIGWHGGTQIGRSLGTLVEDHGMRVLRPNTAFIILSDGLDVGPPAQLADALRAVKLRVKRVIWLNPLLSTRGYEPTARGMAAALPLLDVFAPAHDLRSLMDIERHLRK